MKELGELLEARVRLYASLEVAVREALKPLEVLLLKPLLDKVLTSKELLSQTQDSWAVTLGMRFKGYRQIAVRLGNGETIRVSSAYFSKAKAKSGRKVSERGVANEAAIWD